MDIYFYDIGITNTDDLLFIFETWPNTLDKSSLKSFHRILSRLIEGYDGTSINNAAAAQYWKNCLMRDHVVLKIHSQFCLASDQNIAFRIDTVKKELLNTMQ